MPRRLSFSSHFPRMQHYLATYKPVRVEKLTVILRVLALWFQQVNPTTSSKYWSNSSERCDWLWHVGSPTVFNLCYLYSKSSLGIATTSRFNLYHRGTSREHFTHFGPHHVRKRRLDNWCKGGQLESHWSQLAVDLSQVGNHWQAVSYCPHSIVAFERPFMKFQVHLYLLIKQNKYSNIAVRCPLIMSAWWFGYCVTWSIWLQFWVTWRWYQKSTWHFDWGNF